MRIRATHSFESYEAFVAQLKSRIAAARASAAFIHIIQPMLDRIYANLRQSRTRTTLRDTNLMSGEIRASGN